MLSAAFRRLGLLSSTLFRQGSDKGAWHFATSSDIGTGRWLRRGVGTATTGNSPATSTEKKLVLVDGNLLFYRSLFGTPSLSTSDGRPSNAIHGFLTYLFKLQEVDPSDICIVFDRMERPKARTSAFPDYKSGRSPLEGGSKHQLETLQGNLASIGWPTLIAPEEMEADDVIHVLATNYAQPSNTIYDEVTIISSDKDLWPLLQWNKVQVVDPTKRNKVITAAMAMSAFQVSRIDSIPDVVALMGDKSDNLPGIPGLGAKRAATLIEAYGSVEGLIEAVEGGKITSSAMGEQVRQWGARALSVRAIREPLPWPTQVPLPEPDAFRPCPSGWVAPTSRAFYEQWQLKKIAGTAELLWSARQAEQMLSPLEAFRQGLTLCWNDPTGVADLEAWLQQCRKGGAVAMDLCTEALPQGTAPPSRSEGKIMAVGMALTAPNLASIYLPMGHVDSHGIRLPSQWTLPAWLALLGNQLWEQDDLVLVSSNLKRLWLQLKQTGLLPSLEMLQCFDDSYMMYYALYCGKHALTPEGAINALLPASMPIPKEGKEGDPPPPTALSLCIPLPHPRALHPDLTGRARMPSWDAWDPIDAAAYSCARSAAAMALWQHCSSQLLKQGLSAIYDGLDRSLIRVLTAMEYRGIYVDTDHLELLSGEYEEEELKLEAQIHQEAGQSFNIQSPQQLGEVLFGPKSKLAQTSPHVNAAISPKSGHYATGSEVLESLAKENNRLAALVLKYRAVRKLQSTYVVGLKNAVRENSFGDGRVHSTFHSALTSTGRLSSSAPNLQNIPQRSAEGQRIRKAFRPTTESRVFLCADYSQVELRVLAHVANIPELKEAFAAGGDVHALTASQVFQVPLDEVTKEIRQRAKAINFGIIYGMSEFGLAHQLSISVPAAKTYIKSYFEQYPGIRNYMDETIAGCTRTGYVETWLGRRCYIPDINSPLRNKRKFAERSAINTPIQGTAADLARLAMISADTMLRENSHLSADMILQVHDELVFEVEKANADTLAALVVGCMENVVKGTDFSVPLMVDWESRDHL
jgi:DNA polymerase I